MRRCICYSFFFKKFVFRMVHDSVYMYACICICMHTRVHAYIHTYMYMYIPPKYTYMHTCTYTYRLILRRNCQQLRLSCTILKTNFLKKRITYTSPHSGQLILSMCICVCLSVCVCTGGGAGGARCGIRRGPPRA